MIVSKEHQLCCNKTDGGGVPLLLFGVSELREPIKTEIGWIAACPLLAIRRDGPPSEGAISAVKTAPAPSGRSSAAGKISGSRVLPRRWPEASRHRGRGGGLQIVGVATTTRSTAQRPPGNSTGFDLLAVRLDRLVGPDTKVHAIIGGRRRTPLGTPDIKGRTCLGVRASGLAPCDEPLDGGAERRRVVPMLHDGHRREGHIA